jgi:hypothetical protein
VGFTIKILDIPSPELLAKGIQHNIGTVYNAPQATLMATLIRGIQSRSLDWNFVLAGAALALVMELCGVRSLSFAIGVYLPFSTTFPIFLGGMIRGAVDKVKLKRGTLVKGGGEDLEKGNLFATGLVGGGALMGVIFAFLQVPQSTVAFMKRLSVEKWLTGLLSEDGYYLLGFAFFAIMGYALFRAGISRDLDRQDTGEPIAS